MTALMALIVRDRAKKMQTSAVEPSVLAAAVSAMIWGLVILEPRWQEALELDGMPLDQVATIISAMLDT